MMYGVRKHYCTLYPSHHNLLRFSRDPGVLRAAAGCNPSAGTAGSTLQERVVGAAHELSRGPDRSTTSSSTTPPEGGNSSS